jgi:nucleotide-binding universal stress UspA family protein
MAELSSQPVVVAGVLPEQPLWVLQVAGEYARAFGASLVCVAVRSSQHPMQGFADGSLIAAPIEPTMSLDGPAFSAEWLGEVSGLLDPLGVPWSVREAVGEPSTELVEVADEVNALMIVVGTRHQRLRGTLHHFLAGSVALRLAHRQYRPVIVVPVEPSVAGERLPWEGQKQEPVSP